MFINVLEHTDECRCFSNPAAMNTYLMLYKKSIGQEYITSWNGVSITLSAGQTIASKYYIAKVFKCSMDKAKNYLKTLVRNGLIKLEYNETIKQNVITIPAVNPEPGTKYVQMQLPGDKVHDIYTNRCKYLTNIYMYLTLHARKQDGTSYLSGGDVLRGELVDTLHAIASVCGCCVKTVSNVLKNLKEKGVLAFEAIKNVAMKVKLLLYPALKTTVKKVAHIFVKKDINKDMSTLEKKVDAVSVPENEIKTNDEKIIETPVTDAIKYLFFDLKKNKDISHLNQIIEYVNANIPVNFPLDKLKDAMNYYYKENGEKYPSARLILQAIVNFNSKLQKHGMVQSDAEYKICELQENLRIEEAKFQKSSENWRAAKRAYEIYETTKVLDTIPTEYIEKIYIAIWFQNQRQKFVDEKLLKQVGNRMYPAEWSEEICRKAAYIEGFFKNISDYDSIEKKVLAERKNDYIATVSAIKEAIHKLKI